MAPRPWHTPEQRAYFMQQMPEFIRRRIQGKLYKFWGPMYEGWFHKWPEQAVLGLPLPSAAGDAPNLSDEQLKTLGLAIDGRKRSEQKLLNYFNNNTNHLQPGAAKHAKSDLALGRMLFKAKPARRRAHKPIEIFQLRNNDRIREECSLAGHDELNEEVMSKAVDNWVDEDDDEQVARVREAAAARLRIRHRVVNALFADATLEELEAIAEVVEKEKASGKKMGDKEDDSDGDKRTPAEYQASIDESWDVVKMVHKALGRMTGWYGMTVWGGPNPRIGGELSMKCVSFGISPSGNDFEASHATFEKSVALPFQIFLKRCFSPQVRLERSALGAPGEEADELDPAFRVHEPEPEAEGTKLTKPKAPKRIRKSKKKAQGEPASGDGPVPLPTQIQVPAPSSGGDLDGTASFMPTSSLAQGAASVGSTTAVAASSTAPPGIVHTAAATSCDASTASVVGEEMQTLEDLSGRFGMDEYRSQVLQPTDDFDMGGGSGYDLGMPPLPSGGLMGWNMSPEADNYALPLPPLPPVHAEGTYTFPPSLTALTIHKARPCFQGAQYPLNRQPSPTPNYGTAGYYVPPTGSNGSVPTATSPARFRRVSSLSSPLQPASPMLSVSTSLQATSSSSPQHSTPISTPLPPTSLSTAPQPTSSSPAAPAAPVYPRSRPSANVPKAAGEKKVAPVKRKTQARKKTVPGAEAETAAAEAGKVAAKRGRKPGSGSGKGRDGGDVQNPTENLDNTMMGVLGDASNNTSTALVYTSTNNNRIYARQAREAEEARRATKDAARAADLAEKARVFNPDGPTDLVILPPPPGREKRARKAATHPDGSHVTLVPKVTRAQQLELRNKYSENALLARTGRLPAAITTTKSKKK